MKKLISLLLALSAVSTIFAQIQLRQLNGTQTRKIDLNTDITLRLNTPTAFQTYNTYHDYQGKLLAFVGDSIELKAQKEIRYYADERGLYRMVNVDYCCPPSQEAIFMVPTEQILSIRKGNPDIIRGTGGLVLMLTLLQSVVVSPLLNTKARKTSDITVAGGAVVGLGLIIFPRQKVYHLAASPKEGVKRWRIVGR